jgi:endonuclease III
LAPLPDWHVLREFYGLLPPPPTDPFQFLLWEIVSDMSLPARRDLAWQALRRIPALTPDSIFRTPQKTLAEAIGMAGPHREERIEQIRAATGEFRRHRDTLAHEALAAAGLLKAARTLRRLPDVPRETLDRALLYAGGYAVLPLDDGTARVVARLIGTAIAAGGVAEGSTLKRAQLSRELTGQRRGARKALAATLPRDPAVYGEALLYLRHHSQHTCLAIGPHCAICPLRPGCAFAAVNPQISGSS